MSEIKLSAMDSISSLPNDAVFYTVLPDGSYGKVTKSVLLDGLGGALSQTLTIGGRILRTIGTDSILASADKSKFLICNNEDFFISIPNGIGANGDEFKILNPSNTIPPSIAITGTSVSIFYNGEEKVNGDSITIPVGSEVSLFCIATNTYFLSIKAIGSSTISTLDESAAAGNTITDKSIEFTDTSGEHQGSINNEQITYNTSSGQSSLSSIMLSLIKRVAGVAVNRINIFGDFIRYSEIGVAFTNIKFDTPTGNGTYKFRDLGNATKYTAITDDIHENIVQTIAKNPDGQFSFPHGTLQIGDKFYIGTREGSTSKLLRYNGTSLEESITIPCTSTIGLESLCVKPDNTRIYGIRHNASTSYIYDVNPNNFTDINYHIISGVNLLGSPAIVTDGTYIYGVENTTPTCKFFKIRISDWSTIATNTWTGVGGGHWGKINIADGVAYFTSQNGYYAKVSLSDLSYIQMDLREDLSIITDDNDFCPAENNSAFVNYTIVGGEYRDETTGKGGVIIDNDNWTKLPFNLLPTYCLKFNNDYSKLYSCSNVGYIEEFDFESLIFNLQYNQPYTTNTYTFRQGGVPNELFFNTDNEPFCTNWISGGNLFKIELTPFLLPLITERESYYRSLNPNTQKLSYITITQPVDLDAIETRINELDAAVILKGTWSASSGTFPGGGVAQAGWSYLVTSDATVDGVEFKNGDRIICVLDNASTTTYAGNWYKADYTDRVNTVCGRTGNVVITSSDLSDFNSAVNSLIGTALASFKTANFLDFTSSGQTQLNNKQPLLVYSPFRFVQTSQTAHTGTTAKTVIATATINGATFNVIDLMRMIYGLNKGTTTSGATMRIEINTVNNPATATQIAAFGVTGSASDTNFKRNFVLNGGSLFGVNFASTTIVNDEVNVGATYSSTPYNTANTLFVFFSIQLVTSTDSVTPNLTFITN